MTLDAVVVSTPAAPTRAVVVGPVVDGAPPDAAVSDGAGAGTEDTTGTPPGGWLVEPGPPALVGGGLVVVAGADVGGGAVVGGAHTEPSVGAPTAWPVPHRQPSVSPS